MSEMAVNAMTMRPALQSCQGLLSDARPGILQSDSGCIDANQPAGATQKAGRQK
jgi:hypothetical protein